MTISPSANKYLYSALSELGLSRKEAQLYITALSLGPCSVTTLAKSLNMARPNVYKLIKVLEQQRLTTFSQRKENTHDFTVISPAIVLDKIRQKRQSLKQLDDNITADLANFMTLYHQGETPTKIKILTGEDDYLKVFFQILDEAKDNIEYFGSAEDFIGFISWSKEKEWIKKRMKKNLHIKALLLPSESAENLKKLDSKEMRKTHILKDLSPFVTSFQLFSNKVILWQPKSPLAVLIEDQYFVEMLHSVFNKLWTDASK